MFRGFNHISGWCYGFLVKEQFTAYNQHHQSEYSNKEYLDYEQVKTGLSECVCSYGYQIVNGTSYKWVKKESVGQTTGLCDKKGVEIFKKDIVLYEIWHGAPEHEISGRTNWFFPYIVEWHQPSLRFQLRQEHHLLKHYPETVDLRAKFGTENQSELEVIGNTYEDPELKDMEIIK